MTKRTVRVAVLSSGERLPLLVEGGPWGIPDTEATRYTLACLRQRNAPATIRHKLMAIGLGKDFCETREIDLVERAARGAFLNHDELAAFAESCLRRRDGAGVVDPSVATEQYRAFMDFVSWLTAPVLARASDEDRGAVHAAAAQFAARATALAPRRSGAARRGGGARERCGLDPEQRALLLRVVEPGSPQNPWRAGVQHRNRAIVATAYSYGLRSGEILALKVRDFRQAAGPATLTVHRRHGDPEDPRADQPVAKTLPRVLELDEENRKILTDWVLQHRSDRKRFPGARRHPFLFVNRSGAPIGKRGYEKIFVALRRRHPTLGPLVNHVLRHDWNERYTEMAEELGWDPAEAEKDQKYAMGWSNASKMPERYSRRAIGKRANKRIAAMQRRAAGGA